jgi:Na+/H+ antiporter NhaC
MPAYLFIALIAALGYSIGSIFNKQAMTEGCGSFRVFAAMTWTTTGLLLPFIFFHRNASSVASVLSAGARHRLLAERCFVMDDGFAHRRSQPARPGGWNETGF